MCQKLLHKALLFALLIILVILLEIFFYIISDDYNVFENHNIYVHLTGALTGAFIGFLFIINMNNKSIKD